MHDAQQTLDLPVEPKRLPAEMPSKENWPIDHDLPILADRSGGKRVEWDKARLPFERLEKRLDSFAVDPNWFEGADMLRTQNWLSGAASSYSKAHGVYFTTRQDWEHYCVRVWRIDPEDRRGRGSRRPIEGIDR